MASRAVALYYGIGVALSQSLHTLYTQRNVAQKKVPLFEWTATLRSWGRANNVPVVRQLPDLSRAVDPPSLQWLQPHEVESLHPLFTPWKLKYFQRLPPPYASRWTRLTRLLGLQATNLVYCYLAALAFGVVSVAVLLFTVPSPDTFTSRNVVHIFLTFGLLILLSWTIVGSSFAQVSIESTLALNSIALLTIEVADPSIATSLLGMGVSIAIARLLNWIGDVRADENFDRDNLVAGYYAVGSFIYAESIVLAILLTALE